MQTGKGRGSDPVEGTYFSPLHMIFGNVIRLSNFIKGEVHSKLGTFLLFANEKLIR